MRDTVVMAMDTGKACDHSTSRHNKHYHGGLNREHWPEVGGCTEKVQPLNKAVWPHSRLRSGQGSCLLHMGLLRPWEESA